jgi:ribosomal protein S18 acetylase RimI-like enzyme
VRDRGRAAAGAVGAAPPCFAAGAADLDDLVRLVVRFRDHLGESSPVEGQLRRSLETLLGDPLTEFLLLRDESGAIGYVQLRYRHSAWRSAPEAELEDLFVVAEARGRGAGRRLVEAAVAGAARRGCRSVGLNTNERNAGALALYRSAGFAAERARWEDGRQLWLERAIEPDGPTRPGPGAAR